MVSLYTVTTRMAVMAFAAEPSQATSVLSRGLASVSHCWGPMGVLESSFFSPQLPALKASQVSGGTFIVEPRCWRCAYVEEALTNADRQLVKEKQKRTSKKGRTGTQTAAAVTLPSSAVATNHEHIDIEAFSLEELALKYQHSALLESAFRQPAFEPMIRLENIKEFEERQSSSRDASVHPQPVTVKTHKRRLSLASRMSLHRRRIENLLDPTPTPSSEVTEVQSGEIDPWSQEAGTLIKEYSSSLNVLSFDWDKLPRDRLTGPEEIRLACFMNPAKKLQQMRLALSEGLKREPLEEEWAKVANMTVQTLRRYLQSAQAARNKMIKHNLRLVAHQAHKYYREEMSLSLFDLCQEGVQGLIRAVDKFSSTKGYRFSTYAVYWVKNSILRAQTRLGHIVRIPYNVAAQKMNIQRKRVGLSFELGREPTPEEVMKKVGMDSKRYYQIMRTGGPCRSLHARSRITGDEFIHGLSDPNDAETQYLKSKTLRFAMDDVLDSLKPKESLVIRQRYGLDGKGERSFTEIGRNLNLSREMVRRYEIRGLLKLKHPTRMKYLHAHTFEAV